MRVTASSSTTTSSSSRRRRPRRRAAYRGRAASTTRGRATAGCCGRRRSSPPAWADTHRGSSRAPPEPTAAGSPPSASTTADPRRPLLAVAVAGQVAAFGNARVQVRSLCDSDENVLVVEAKRLGARVAASSLLRRASFSRARGARGCRARSSAARYDLRRSRANISRPVRPAGTDARAPCGSRPALRLMFEPTVPNLLTVFRILLCPVARGGAAVGHRDRGHPGRDRVRDRELHRRAGRLDRAPQQGGHDVREADGPARRQAARSPPRSSRSSRSTACGVGGDGDHRARVRRHGPAPAGDGARRGDPGLGLGQAQDRSCRSRWCSR